MFNIFGKKAAKDRNFLEVKVEEPIDCLCDFTFNFHWQHQGEKLDPTWKIPGNNLTFGEVVDHLKKGGDIRIRGDAGHRLSSSMGVDLKYFGGSGLDLPVGDVFVEGNVDTRMGISMTRGSIFVKGKIKEPIGNLVEVSSKEKSYRQFRSITDVLKNGLGGDKILGSNLTGKKLMISDNMVRDTVGARLDVDGEIIIERDVDLSTGILMRKGVVRVNGNAGKNTGALLNGGTVIVNGNTDDFTAIDMIKGSIIVNGDAGKFLAANKKNGQIFAKKASPIPPTKKSEIKVEDRNYLFSMGMNPKGFFKFY